MITKLISTTHYFCFWLEIFFNTFFWNKMSFSDCDPIEYKTMAFWAASCEVCNRLKNKRGQWNRHYKTVHLKIKNYLCPFCDKRFGENANLKKHMMKCKSQNSWPSKWIYYHAVAADTVIGVTFYILYEMFI